MKSLLLSLAIVVASCFAAYAQLPYNGAIGVFGDAQATQQCIQAVPFQLVTLYVVALLYGGSSEGITGAEYRIEFSDLSRYHLLPFQVVPDASVSIGSPLDSTACDQSPAGTVVAFPSCRRGSRVLLGTFGIISLGATHPIYIMTKRSIPSMTPGWECPRFYACDAPFHHAMCLTPVENDPANEGYEPVSLLSAVNPPYCDDGPPAWRCPPLAVLPGTWSVVKSIYR